MAIKRFSFVALALLVTTGCATSTRSDDDGLAAPLERMLAGESQLRGADYEEAVQRAAQFPLGSEGNPVRVAMPTGERAYLARLRCADGTTPSYERSGSGGASPYGNIIDYYEVTCPGMPPRTVIMDMYHAGFVEDQPVPGFTIVPR